MSAIWVKEYHNGQYRYFWKHYMIVQESRERYAVYRVDKVNDTLRLLGMANSILRAKYFCKREYKHR